MRRKRRKYSPPLNFSPWRRFKELTLESRLYLTFIAVALLVITLSVLLFLPGEDNLLSAQLKVLLGFLFTYSFIAMIIVGFSSSYHKERNVIAAMVPAFMTAIGLIISFWLYGGYIYQTISGFSIGVSVFLIFYMPLFNAALKKSLSIKSWKLYFSGFAQIIVTGLIVWQMLIWFI